MEYVEVIKLLASKQNELKDYEIRLINRLERCIQRNIEPSGDDRVSIGKLYKRFTGTWPFKDNEQDKERKQVLAKTILLALAETIEHNIITPADNEKEFITRALDKIKNKVIIQDKEFSFLWYLNKKYEKETRPFMKSSKESK